MSNWKLINKTYLYDGTLNGFLTIVFDSYRTKTFPQKIEEEKHYSPNFLDDILSIQTDFEKATRIFNGIEKNISYTTLYNTYYAFLSHEKEKEMHLLKYLCDGFATGPKINNRLTLPYVYQVMNMKKRSFGECHRLKGLLRFQEVGKNLYYASIHPDNNIIEPLGHHFIHRLPNQNFIIHDKTRNICLLYNTNEYQIVNNRDLKIPAISAEEQKYQELWKLFFNTIAISERKNPRCQMQCMPKKYWKDLIEDPYS